MRARAAFSAGCAARAVATAATASGSARSAGATALGAALAVSIAVPAAAGAAVVLQDGHVDVAARIVDGALRMQVKDGTAGAGAVVWREPAETVLHARPASATTVPAGATMGFLGVPGAPLWLLPQVQRAGLLWPGWNTEQLPAADVAGTVRWTLTGVEGPGRFALFTTGTFGAVDKLFDSGDGLPDAREIPLGTHAHGNWAFSAEGLYRLSFELRARRPSGETMTDARTVAVTVGAVDPATGAPLGGGGDPGSGPGRGGDGSGGNGGGGGSGGSGGSGTPGGGARSGGAGGGKPGAGGGSRTDGRSRRAQRSRLKLVTSGPATARGRMLTVRLRIGTKARVRVTVRRSGRTVARAPIRLLAPSARVFRVRLNRNLTPGRYRVRVTARAGARSATQTVALRAVRR